MLDNDTSITTWSKLKTIMAVTLTAALSVLGSRESQFRRVWRCSIQVREGQTAALCWSSIY